ncbi:MAG: twin-arginine translocation signal domain-containing protein [Pirellulaceae bacterium]
MKRSAVSRRTFLVTSGTGMATGVGLTVSAEGQATSPSLAQQQDDEGSFTTPTSIHPI